jgi:hypothetical protein
MSNDIKATIDERPITATIQGAVVNITGGGGGVTDGDKGDITVSSFGTVWTVDANAITNAKSAQMATKTYKGRTTAGTGNAEDVPVATLKTDLSLVKGDVGLGNVDNTSDLNKPISTATQTALDGKQPIATVLTNTTASFTTAQETKLAGIATGAEVNVNADWNAVSGDAQILNKPTISGTNTGDQTSIVGITGTLTEFNTALTGADFATGGGTASGTNTGDQNLFSTIAVAGQSNVVADSTSDTLTLVAGSNIVLTTNATNDEIAIASTGGGITDGDKGDILVSGGGATWTIQNMDENATVTTGTYVSNANQSLLIKVRKSTAGTITKGQVVYIVGSTGTHLTVELAQANAEATSAYTIGIAATTITGSNDGFVMQYGRLTALSTLPTASFADGDAIYLSETTAGGYRVGAPIAPNHGVLLGFVIRTSNGSAGEIDVRIQNYQEFDELSDVNITSETADDFIIRNATNTRWENITPANVKTKLAINNVDNTSDANKPISTATQTALNAKENTITAGTTAQYYRGDKTFQTLDKTAVGLGNVDNTSDVNKPISTATQTALDLKQKTITSGTASPSGGVDGDIYLQYV